MRGMRKLILLALCTVILRPPCRADEPRKVVTKPTVQTDRLGGVDVPNADVLKKMHVNQYILRARRAASLPRFPQSERSCRTAAR